MQHYDSTHDELDLTSFPLLRIDQLHLHTNNVLQGSQEKLSALADEVDSDEIFRGYANKLIDLIRKETAQRRVIELLSLSDADADEEEGTMNRSSNVITTQSPIPAKHSSPRGFKARAKVRASELKAKRMTDTDEYRNKLFEKDKLQRRNRAKERLNERRIRRAKVEAKLEGRRLEKIARENAQREKMEEIKVELEQVASATVQLIKDHATGGDRTEVYVNAAIAATKVLEKADVDVLNSDSGSSLVSDVDSCAHSTQIELVAGSNDTDDDLQSEANLDDGSCALKDEYINSCDEAKADKPKEHYLHECADTNTQKTSSPKLNEYVRYSNTLNGSLSQKAHLNLDEPAVATFLPPVRHQSIKDYHFEGSQKNNCDEMKEEWAPWVRVKDTTTGNLSSLSPTSSKPTHAFTNIFPTFNSIFTAFASSGQYPRIDRNLKIERECLEYQVRVHASLQASGFTSEHGNASNKSLVFCTKSKRKEVASIVSDVLLNQEDMPWFEVSESSNGNCWNLLWTWKKPKLNPEHLLVYQRISRFQDTRCLTRKDYLKKQLERTRASIISRFQHNWDLMPLTFVLPNEFTSFLSAYSSIQNTCQERQSTLWIMKPSAMSKGRGISIVDDIGKVTYSSPTVIQQYLRNPLLLQGYKFDLRLYILVTSFSPLEAFIYKEGFARFGSRKFTSHADSINDLQIHLTNSSIQNSYIHDINANHPAQAAGKDGGGNKVLVTWLWSRLRDQGIDVDELWKDIKELCVKTLLSTGDEIPSQPNAFELFGFDVIIDDECKPWLIEVNACPALSREHHLDVAVKEALLLDIIKIVSPPAYNRDALAEICKRRLFNKKRSSSKSTSERDILEQDLRLIFNDEIPRQYGQEPEGETEFERLAPGDLFEDFVKQKGSRTKTPASSV